MNNTKEKDFIADIENYQAKKEAISNFWAEKEVEPDITEELLSLLSNESKPKFDSYAEELSLLSQSISKVADSIDENILSEKEAEILIRRMFASFISRRLDNIVDNLFTKKRTNWFLTAKHHYYERG